MTTEDDARLTELSQILLSCTKELAVPSIAHLAGISEEDLMRIRQGLSVADSVLNRFSAYCRWSEATLEHVRSLLRDGE